MEHSVSYTKCHDDVLTVRLEHEFLAHPTQDPTDALAHLEQVSKNVADLASRTAQVRRYQMALHQELLDASDLILLMCALSSLEQLWRAAESWRSQTTYPSCISKFHLIQHILWHSGPTFLILAT